MINDLRLPEEFLMWKFADDTTVSEVVPVSKLSTLQQAADYIYDWSQETHLQLNPTKCKEIRTYGGPQLSHQNQMLTAN